MSPQRPASHFIPRTAGGWTATISFLGIFLLAMPPITHLFLDRPENWFAGVPFFVVSLLLIYTVLIGVLLCTLKKGV